MSVVAFLIGLVVGGGICLWQNAQQRRQWNHLLQKLPPDATEATLSPRSQMRQALSHLSQRQEYLQAQLDAQQQILELAPIAYVQVDGENHPITCNREARSLLKIYNWTPDSDRVLLEIVRSYELDRLIEKTRQERLAHVREWQFFATCSNADEIVSQQPQTLKAYSIPLEGGNVGVFLENQQPLIELRQSRDRWMSDLAHELRTPLTSIQLVVETLIERLDPPMKNWVERLLPETQRLIQLVQDWLELNQIEANRSLQTEPIPLQPLIRSVWQTLEPLADRQQVRWAYRELSNDTPLWLEGDKAQLYRVFLNLLDNAVRYSPENSTIRVEAEVRSRANGGDLLRVHIIDSGCGFQDSDLPHIFDRLYRGDLGRGRLADGQVTSSGSGLGLAIVKQIVLAHGGRIQAQNHPETGGAWMQVDLCASQPPD